MQKWEYKLVFRCREWAELRKNLLPLWAGDWKTVMEDDTAKEIDIIAYMNELGEQGWELVSIVAESGIHGGASTIHGSTTPILGEIRGLSTDYAGFVNEEKLIFKRPKP